MLPLGGGGRWHPASLWPPFRRKSEGRRRPDGLGGQAGGAHRSADPFQPVLPAGPSHLFSGKTLSSGCWVCEQKTDSLGFGRNSQRKGPPPARPWTRSLQQAWRRASSGPGETAQVTAELTGQRLGRSLGPVRGPWVSSGRLPPAVLRIVSRSGRRHSAKRPRPHGVGTAPTAQRGVSARGRGQPHCTPGRASGA